MPAPTSIPLFHVNHSAEMEQAALEVLRSGQIASGPNNTLFERRFGELVGRPHVVCTADMTSALVLGLHLAGVRAGDEVLTLAYSCMSSNAPIALLGASAIWVDIDPASAAMSVEDFKRALSPRAKAVLLYHVAGYPGPAAEIAALCRERGIAVIEDCNNALGATRHALPVGSVGDYAAFSFYPNRQINAIEGAALVCPDTQTAARANRLRRYGIDANTFRDSIGEINSQSDIPEIGWSANFSHLHASIALPQLASLESKINKTRRNCKLLQETLADTPGVSTITPLFGAEPAYWAFLTLVGGRDQLLSRLKANGIQASKLHFRNDAYSGYSAADRKLPGTDKFMAEIIALPCGWWLEETAILAIASTLIENLSTSE